MTIECVIEQKHHRTVMGAKGFKVQEITKEYEVGIKFPDRPNNNQQQQQPVVNGEAAVNGAENGSTVSDDAASDDAPNKSDIILITGKRDNCEAAAKALQALVPITEEMEVAFDLHRFIIGQKGRDVRKMMEDNDVNISIPPGTHYCLTSNQVIHVYTHLCPSFYNTFSLLCFTASEKSDIVRITGAPKNVARAVKAMEGRVEQLEGEQKDRELRSFKLEVSVDPKYHPKIIGRRGAVISKIRDSRQVNIQFPEKGSEFENIITITGYEEATKDAEADIMKIVSDLVSDSISLFHSFAPNANKRI